MSYDISFIILTWNSEKYISNCIKSYADAMDNENLFAEFLIVDNGSTDSTVSIIEDKLLGALPPSCCGKIYKLKKNLGTTVPRNLALRNAVGRYIAICDSDTEYLDGKWKKAIDFIEYNKTIGILAPQLLYPDGTVQNSIKAFPTATDKALKLFKIFFKLQIKNTDFYSNFSWDSCRHADTAISACWIFSKETYRLVGDLDERIFYSPEDVDYCLRMWRHGKSILYYPELRIRHHTQQISHKKPFSRQSLSHLYGLIYYFYKHNYFLSCTKLRKKISTGYGITLE